MTKGSGPRRSAKAWIMHTLKGKKTDWGNISLDLLAFN